MKYKGLIFRMTAIGLSTFITLLFIEIVLRIFGPKYYRFDNRSHEEYYTNPRGYHIPIRKAGRYTVYGLKYNESPEIYRLPDKVLKNSKIKKNLKILGLGDSFTYGRGVKYKDIYLTKLEKLLSQNYGRIGIKNCGMPAADIGDMIRIYLYEVHKKIFPLVVYGFVLNDFGLPGSEEITGLDFIDINNAGNRFNPLRKNLAIVNFVFYSLEKYRLHKITIQAYKNAFKGECGERGFRKLKELNGIIETTGGRLVLMIFPLLYDFEDYPFKEIHTKIIDFCNKENIPVLDLLPSFSQYKAKELWANPTDHHPNEIAHNVAANELYKFLQNNKLLNNISNNKQK
ncbi:MAG: SGNH/GDSL hydrolase family protein [Elusimicrobia bacterium]|nr:SGNH/GDSL hydrolase family protein [Elusimicrobiota bacterium]